MVAYQFYQVEDLSPASLEAVLPDLIKEPFEAGTKISICSGPNRIKRFDDALWSFEGDSFLAHGLASGEYAEKQPILLESRPEARNGAEIIVLVGFEKENYPEFPAQVTTVIDLFNAVEIQKKSARVRWKVLKERGAEQSYFSRQDDTWAQKA